MLDLIEAARIRWAERMLIALWQHYSNKHALNKKVTVSIYTGSVSKTKAL